MKLVARLYPERYSPSWQYNATAFLYAASLLCFVFLIVFAIQVISSRSEARDAVELDVWDKGDTAARAVDAHFHASQDGIEAVADVVGAGGLDTSGIEEEIARLIRSTPEMRRAGYILPPGTEQGAENGNIVVFTRATDNPGDITIRRENVDPAEAFEVGGAYAPYMEVTRTASAGWIAPQPDLLEDSTLVPFVSSVRFGVNPDEPLGVIFGDVSLGSLSGVFAWMTLGESGYGFLADAENNFALHPDSELLRSGTGLTGVTGISDSAISQLVANSIDSKISLHYYDSEIDGSPSLLSLHAIPATGWNLGYIAFESHVLKMTDTTKKAQMRLAASVLALLFFLLIIVTRAYAGSLSGLWTLSLSTGIIFSVGIVAIWYLFANTVPNSEPSRVDLVDAIEQQKKYLEDNFDGRESIDLVVGVGLTSVAFTNLGQNVASADEVLINGFIWHKCLDCGGKGREIGDTVLPLARGFIFPEVREVEFVRLPIYRSGLQDTTPFSFSAVVSRKFRPAQYPFDRDEVALRIWHVDFDTEVLLIPDLADYTSLLFTSKPGLATEFDIAGWITEGTYFTYDVVNYHTTFGRQEEIGTTHSTDLIYKISVRRNFVNAFISNVLPMAIILNLLFLIFLITPKSERYVLAFAGGRKSEGSGDPPSGSPTYTLIAISIILGYTGALLFAVILAHSRLRNEIPADGILYLEYFYFCAYFAILAVTVNGLAFASHIGGRFVHFRDNLIPRTAYWPLITVSLFIVTFVTFY